MPEMISLKKLEILAKRMVVCERCGYLTFKNLLSKTSTGCIAYLDSEGMHRVGCSPGIKTAEHRFASMMNQKERRVSGLTTAKVSCLRYILAGIDPRDQFSNPEELFYAEE